MCSGTSLDTEAIYCDTAWLAVVLLVTGVLVFSGMVWLPKLCPGVVWESANSHAKTWLEHFLLLYSAKWRCCNAQGWSQVLFHLLMPTVNPRMGYSGARAKDNRVCLIERTSMYIQLSFSIDLKRSSSKFSKMFLFFLFSWETIFPTTVTIHIY